MMSPLKFRLINIMDIFHVVSENTNFTNYFAKFQKITIEQLPDTPICTVPFRMSLHKVLSDKTLDSLVLREGTEITAIIQVKLQDDHIFIGNFCSVKKGSGAILLNEIIALKKDILLSPDEFGGDEDSLIKYYERFGFVKKGKDMELKAGMRKHRRKQIRK